MGALLCALPSGVRRFLTRPARLPRRQKEPENTTPRGRVQTMTPPLPSRHVMLARGAALMVLIVLAVTAGAVAGAGAIPHPAGGAAAHADGHDRGGHSPCPAPCPDPDCHWCHCTTTILSDTALAMSPPASHWVNGGDGDGSPPDPPPRSIFHPPRPAVAAHHGEHERNSAPANAAAGVPRECRP